MGVAQHPKWELIQQLLEQGMVMVTLDARREGVEVPPHLANDRQLRLNISYRFGLPMHVDATGVRATLTFAGVSHDCMLPWESIYVAFSHVTGEPYVFSDDVPPELVHELKDAPPGEAGRARFILLEGDSEQNEGESPAPTARRGHLRLVK